LLGDRIVATVMSNGGLKESLAAEGIAVEECAVGDSFVYRKMNESGAVLGGEQSGHIIFGKLESTGDGLVTAIMVMEAMSERDSPLSELVRGLKKRPQLTVNVRVRDKSAALDSPKAVAAINSAQKLLKGRGRLIVRKSGTEELIRITVEAKSQDECERICNEIEDALLKGGEAD
ncbi:MAG: phosphoglucosamine mutase, partial [Clostridia bacterium]|nr:phosphoglucosamine mutase [Clostridia bacterium]